MGSHKYYLRLAQNGENHDFTSVHRLSIGEKREFYAGLARLIRSGSSLPAAIDLLSRDTSRGVGKFLRALNERINQGEPLGDALLHQRPKVTELEATIVTAASHGGKLDRGCDQLARYFEALVRARSEMLSRIAYPVVMLHLTCIFLKIQVLLNHGGRDYAVAVLRPLCVIYIAAAGIWLGWVALTRAARTSVLADLIVRRIPGIGPIREKFALARFFATLDAQLEAAVNIWDAFANAARTSDSARIIKAAGEAMPMLRAGERLSEVLSAKKVLPPEYVRSFRVAETAGELDAELPNLAQRSEELAVAALNRWSEWLPRVMYTGVLLYSGWQIVQFFSGYVDSTMKAFDSSF
jgi:type II secretory pathway component PulF